MRIKDFLDLESKVFWDDLYICCNELTVYHYTPWDKIPEGISRLEMESFSAEALKGEKLALIIDI